MKRFLLLTACLLGGIGAVKAQMTSPDVVITNYTCSTISVTAFTDNMCGGGGVNIGKSIAYAIPSGGTLNLSIYPGGTFTAAQFLNGLPGVWIPPAGSDWLRFIGVPSGSGSGLNYEYHPCAGSGTSSSIVDGCSNNVTMTVQWQTSPITVDFN